MSCSKFSAASSKNKNAKDLNFDLPFEDLAKVQRLDATRPSKLQVNEELNSMGKLNNMRVWKRSMAEYTDKLYPGDVMQYVDSIPVKGLPSGTVRKKVKIAKYERKTKPKEPVPVENIKCCEDNCLQEHVPNKDLQVLRNEYNKLPNARAKTDFLREFIDAETKDFSVHGQHLTWQAMTDLFGISRSKIQTVKKTRRAENTGDACRNQRIRGGHVMMNKKETIIAFLKVCLNLKK